MINNLMYVANGLILAGYIGYILLVLVNRKNKIDKVDGFNITKDILNEYDSINIIENTGIFTVYNIRRKVIKIASKAYYGNSVSDISLPLIESGISVIDNGKNKFINFFKNLIPNLKLIYILPILLVKLSIIQGGTTDAKAMIVFTVICIIIGYQLISIKNEVLDWINKKLKKNKNIDNNKITNFISKVILLDKFIFFGELVIIIRCVAILLNI